MRCFLSELLLPEDGDSLLWPCCQRCQCRRDCPYICDQALRRTARQSHAAAQLLTAEAGRLLEALSQAEDVDCLLQGGSALELALSNTLRTELALLRDLRFQAPRAGS